MEYRYILQLITLFVKVYNRSKSVHSQNLIRKVMRLYLRAI